MSNGFQLYLIRHGQSANNALPESQRVEDPGLTELGVSQASLLGQRFGELAAREVRIDCLLTSGFRRAVETMRPVAKSLEIRPSIWVGLHEVGGCFRGHEVGKTQGCPGMTGSQLAEEFPEFDLADEIGEDGWWKNKPFETFEEAEARTQQQAERLLATFHGKDITVACVIHADFKAMLLRQLIGTTDYYAADLVNTGVTLLRYESDAPEVITFNDSSHLPPEQVSS